MVMIPIVFHKDWISTKWQFDFRKSYMYLLNIWFVIETNS